MVRPPIARQLLLDAMRDELIENATAIDLSSVVSRAGVSTGAVYHHFGSKVGLLAAVYSEFFDGSERAVIDAGTGGRTWVEREHRRTEAMVAYYFDNPLAGVIVGRNTEHSAITELETSYLARAAAGVVANLQAAKRDGVLADHVDAELTGAYMVGGLRRSLGVLLRRDPRPSVAQATDELWRLIAATVELPADIRQ